MTFDLRANVPVRDVDILCARFHAYGGGARVSTYSFGVYESDALIAAYTWNPPAPGVGLSMCPEEPQAVLALTRMVAVPRTERVLKHVSKPLMRQMKTEIDRGRWPVLVTYSDASVGHNGYVYQCSGWTKSGTRKVDVYQTPDGVRVSKYSNGKTDVSRYERIGKAEITRWEHRVCQAGKEAEWMQRHGWVREKLNRVWRSGKPAFRIVRINDRIIA